MSDRHYHVILNPNAGTVLALGLTAATLAEKFARAGLHFDIDDDDDKPLEQRIAAALQGPADTIVAAGGDGTVTAIAEALIGTDKTLAVLPLGTMNALGRDLGMPLDVDGAISALASLEPQRIDVGSVNGRLFLHNVLIGVIPSIAVAREAVRHEQSTGAWISFFRFMLRRLARARRIAVAIEPEEGQHRIARLQAIAVANNSYDQRVGGFMTRKRINRGHLTLYMVSSLGVGDVLRLTLEMFAGRWRDDEVINFEHMRKVTLRTKKPSLLVTVDGEVMTLETPLNFEIRPLALSVLGTPVAEPVAETDAAAERSLGAASAGI
ncbi:MAG TPA: diacylglycerol kinase family protein [Devosia sp.]|nr:diacylglycerol kinase family protein [Devosia sp.]